MSFHSPYFDIEKKGGLDTCLSVANSHQVRLSLTFFLEEISKKKKKGVEITK